MNCPSLKHKFKNIKERFLPSFCFVASIAGIFIIQPQWIEGACNKLLNVYFCVFSIALSFEFSFIALLFSMSDKYFIKGMKQSGAYENLIAYHYYSIRWTVFAILISIALLFLQNTEFERICCVIFIGIGCGALASAWRVYHLMKLAIRLTEKYEDSNSS